MVPQFLPEFSREWNTGPGRPPYLDDPEQKFETTMINDVEVIVGLRGDKEEKAAEE